MLGIVDFVMLHSNLLWSSYHLCLTLCVIFVGSAKDFPGTSMVGHSRGSCCSTPCAC